MFIYIALYTFLLICSFADVSKCSQKNKLILLTFLVLVFVLFRGLRWETGTDWEQFEYCFNHADWDNITNYDRYGNGRERMESGYMLLNCIIKIFGNYTLFLLVTNLFIVGSWAKLSYKLVPSKPIMTFAMIMVSNLIFPVRLQLAAGIFCWSIYYLLEKKFLACTIVTIIACSIHKSAIIVSLILPFLSLQIKSYAAIILIMLSLLGNTIADMLSLAVLGFAVLINPLLPDLATNLVVYSDVEKSGYTEISLLSQIISFLFSIILLLSFLYTRHIIAKSSLDFTNKKKLMLKVNIFMNCYIIFTFFLKFFQIPSLANFQRVAEFFTTGYAVSFMLSYNYLKYKISSKFLFAFYIILYLYKLKGLLNTSYPELFYPYISIFDSIKR